MNSKEKFYSNVLDKHVDFSCGIVIEDIQVGYKKDILEITKSLSISEFEKYCVTHIPSVEEIEIKRGDIIIFGSRDFWRRFSGKEIVESVKSYRSNLNIK